MDLVLLEVHTAHAMHPAGAEPGPQPGEQRQKRNAEEKRGVSGTVQGASLQQPKAIPAEQLLRRHFDRLTVQDLQRALHAYEFLR